jgi:tRNA-splicing ligase RtcB
MQLVDGIPVWGDPIEPNALKQIQRCARTADRAALMADHHKGYAVPIGGVVAYADKISPSGVGFDIACGNKAVRTDANADDVRKTSPDHGRGLRKPDLRHRPEKPRAGGSRAVRRRSLEARRRAAAERSGPQPARTVGGGNHYVDVLVDERDRVGSASISARAGWGTKPPRGFSKRAGRRTPWTWIRW